MDRFFYQLENFLKKQVSRRTFLKIGLSGLLVYISNSAFLKFAFAKQTPSGPRIKKNIKTKCDLALAEGDDPFQNTVKAAHDQ